MIVSKVILPAKGLPMVAPASNDEFLELVKKSGVLDEKRASAFMKQARAVAARSSVPSELADALVRDGLLTRFQAEQFMLGKWRRFSIGNYKVLERLGAGGMGNVYLCEHKVMRRRVAVKVLATVTAEDPSALKRFYREARAAAALDHPNIVRAHDIGNEDKLHFLIMDYVDGSSLEEIVRKHGRMDVERAANYIWQSAQGLQYAHKSGLVHRDIKPGNLILDRAGTVKVLDMGVARFCEEDEEVLTKGPLGTADYLAPEQARDSHAADYRADIYGLGATFYYLLTGETPFGDAKTVSQKILFLQTRLPRPISTMRDDVPHELVTIIEKMMVKDPNKRYQTAEEVIRDLSPFTELPIAPPPDSEMPHLSPAVLLLMGDGTDANLGITPMPSSGIGKMGPGSGSSSGSGPSSHNLFGTAPNSDLRSGSGKKQKVASASDSSAGQQPRSIVGVIVASVLISVLLTAGAAVGVWWVYFRTAP